MRRGGFGIAPFLTALLLAASLLASAAHAHVIANWDKSGRSWNNSHMTKIKAAMVAAGHEVLPDGPITETLLRSVNVFVIAEPTAVPTAVELALLKGYIASGGMLLLFGDTGIELPTYNTLLSGVGSSITFTTTTIGTTSALAPGKFTDGPNAVVGSTLSVTSGNGTAGGTLIDNNYVRYESVGNGLVFVFGDRIDHNDVISATNTRLLLNIVAIAAGPAMPVPTLTATGMAAMSALLMMIGLVIIGAGRRSRRQ